MCSPAEFSAEKKMKNERGDELYCRYWNEDGKNDNSNMKGLMFIVHGYCEHCLYYTEVAEMLKEQGFYVFSHDHVGHGQSAGNRAYIQDFDEYVQDVLYHIDLVKKRFPDKPVFLMGHSMGGAVSILTAMKRPDFFRGVILLGPLIIPDRKQATPIKIFLGKLVSKIAPNLIVAKLDPEATSRDQEFVKKYKEDPLVFHGGLKCGWGVAMLNALQKIEQGLPEIKWPFLLVHGTADRLCELEGSQVMYDKAQSSDKQLKVFEGAYHQALNELPEVKSETFSLIKQWLNDRS